jgi:hypothetical protein
LTTGRLSSFWRTDFRIYKTLNERGFFVHPTKRRSQEAMKFKLFAQVVVAGALLAGSVMAADKTKPNLPRTDADITKSVQHELLSYPYYGVFDDLSF